MGPFGLTTNRRYEALRALHKADIDKLTRVSAKLFRTEQILSEYREASDWAEAHACLTGDCHHRSADECLVDLKGVVYGLARELAEERLAIASSWAAFKLEVWRLPCVSLVASSVSLTDTPRSSPRATSSLPEALRGPGAARRRRPA